MKEEHTSGIKPLNRWKYDKYTSGQDINNSNYVRFKKGDYKIELRANEVTRDYQIRLDRNSPKGYDYLSFHTKKWEDAGSQVEALMRMI